MRHFALFTFLLFCTFTSIYAQDKTSTFTKTINLDPEENGMVGNITMVYAFANCFGDALMAFGYQNANFTAVRYKGKEYTASELGLSSFTGETTSFNVTANYYYGSEYLKTNKLTYIINNFDVGCYGQTNTISSSNKNHTSNLNGLSVNFEKATFRISGSLAFKIDNYEKEKLRQRQFFSLLDQAENISDPQQQLAKLKEADRLAKTGGEKRMVEKIRIEAQKKLDSLNQVENNNNNTSSLTNKDEEQEDDESETDDDEENSSNNAPTDYSSLNSINNSRKADLSSEKATAGSALLATSAILATQSSRFGIGGRANMGDELFSYGPELYFMFDETFGINLHYGLGDDDTYGLEDTYDAYEIGAGIIIDFASQENPLIVADGLGLGLEFQYSQFERNIIGESSSFRTYFEEGSIFSMGASIYLGFLKVGYTLPISVERYEDDEIDNEYDPGGSIILGMFFYF